MHSDRPIDSISIMLAVCVSILCWPFSESLAEQPSAVVRVRVTIESRLPYENTPADPEVDCAALIRQAGAAGVLEPQTIEVRNLATNQVVPHVLADEFNTSDNGRIEFVVADPRHTEFEIRFETAEGRRPSVPVQFIPQVGTGDLLRFNAGIPQPLVVPYSFGLHDLTGDGHPDLTGTWNYAWRPGQPWDGVVCFPQVGTSALQFGDLQRPRFRDESDGRLRSLSHTYMGVDFADFNDDRQTDLVMSRRGSGVAEFFLNSGDFDPGGMPRFDAAGTVEIDGWQACRAVDLNNDGALDLVVNGQYVQNQNPDGWPFRGGAPVLLDAGRQPCFLDIDGDGWRDAVCLTGGDTLQPDFYRVAWRPHLGTDSPTFAEAQQLDEISLPETSSVAPWTHAGRRGLIVQHRAFQELSVFELVASRPNAASARGTLAKVGTAESMSAVLSLSDQAWPCLCDWDDDGDPDLLVGGGYGWLRIVINDGTHERPAFRRPVRILADGQPIRLLRNEILGDPDNAHDMGYGYPVFADWNSDGLKDLICPNETNRIFWYPNNGAPGAPQFGPRQQILCDGFPDSDEQRSRSGQRANSPQSSNGIYPPEQERPFFWRTGAAVADFNSDGLMDLITNDGHTRVATLFVQYRDDEQRLRLKKDRVLALDDGRPVNDSIVGRRAHWTESFRAVDWDRDGLQDLIYSVAGAHAGTKDSGSIYLLRNIGTPQAPLFAPPQTMRCFGEPIRISNHGPHPWPGDFDGDGAPDLITCVEWSVYPWYSHAALMMGQRPQYRLELVDDQSEGDGHREAH